MSEQNKFVNILGHSFVECADDPPDNATCPMFTGTADPVFNHDSGDYTCPLCAALVGGDDSEDEAAMMDEDEEDDLAMGSGAEYIAEGEQIQDWSSDHVLTIERQRQLTDLIGDVQELDLGLAIFLAENEEKIMKNIIW